MIDFLRKLCYNVNNKYFWRYNYEFGDGAFNRFTS